MVDSIKVVQKQRELTSSRNAYTNDEKINWWWRKSEQDIQWRKIDINEMIYRDQRIT